MKHSTLRVACVLFVCFSFIATVKAQDDDSKINVVTSAVPFLRISPDARAGGMGDVGIATSADANASFWNLAKIPFAKQKTALGVTYTPWMKDLGLGDVYMVCLGGYHQLDEEQSLAASVRYFSLGNIQFSDYAGNITGDFKPRELGIDLGYTRKLNSKLSAGVALRYINSNLVGGAVSGGTTYKAGNAVAGDISIYSNGLDEVGSGWTWGLVLSNLGTKISYTNDAANKDYIPANFGLGVAYTGVIDETSKFTVGLDINKLMVPTPPEVTGDWVNVDSANLASYRNSSVLSSWFKSFGDAGSFGNELKEFQFSLGAEYTYNDQFSLRAGYFYEDKLKGNRKYFTAGVGLKYNVIDLNFSYLVPSGNGQTRNPLSNTLRLGINFDLGK